jgi:FkbM family methyltransferase
VIRRLMNDIGFDVVRYPHRSGLPWHLSELFRHLEIDTVIDVGANHGQYCTGLRQSGYAGWIYSCEPVKSIFDSLSERMAEDLRWRGFNVALGEVEDRRLLNVAAGDGQASSFLEFNSDGPARWGDAHRVTRKEEVEVRRLERILAEVIAERPRARVFLKLDTQGLDLPILRTAGDRMSAILGLQSEVAVHQFYEGMISVGESITAYQQLGFDITGVFPISREFDNLRVIEFDVTWMRRGSA